MKHGLSEFCGIQDEEEEQNKWNGVYLSLLEISMVLNEVGPTNTYFVYS